MSTVEEVLNLHDQLKPRAVDDYVNFILSRTKPEWQDAMKPLVEADIAGTGIAYAYVDAQTITSAQPLTMQSGEQYGNRALFAPRPGGNGIGFAEAAIIEMQVWLPIYDNAQGQGVLIFVLN